MNIEKKLQSAPDSDISSAERKLLDEGFEKDITGDDLNLKKAELDNTDQDGELLNEQSSGNDISGDDLDIPGAGDDDDNERIGEEDEENNGYSKADTE